MIGLPFYRLLIAAGLVLGSALATTAFSHAEPKGLCGGPPAPACTAPDHKPS
ncbi:hypothetical protein [Methylobacterium sp. Leaf118]|uniref:hypothetical protein n=1 Tax=Methylobacterium sp. Leaf118 TaxID=2876562 RepID=UPI001E44AAA2|nr:hypothetical protein [Methylobacterium sp. Leaf118]